eukprot:TRINITY_DN8441_c0_g1_i1.p1 TRINITY_DN8441_c0_g1~~TRINITY_DN8441_c0_g1_i1.p1  ORF type:complete len:465 (+),score=48.92 TRINITY_DN8441_c0_g1_i1:210-1397(+)
MGGGILALPFCLKEIGLIGGVFMILTVACLVLYTSKLLLFTSIYVFGRSSSYKELSEKALGPWIGPLSVDLSIVLFLYGALTAYIVVIGDAITPSISDLIGFDVPRELVSGATALLILFPLSSLRNIDSLQYTSAIAVVCILFMAGSISISSVMFITKPEYDPSQIDFMGQGFAGLFVSLPIVTFSYTFQPNLFPVWSEMKDYTSKTVTKSVFSSIGLVSTTYILVGIFGYLNFLSETPGNIIVVYTSTVFDVIKILYGAIICFSYPVICYAARKVIDRRIFHGDPPRWRLLLVSFMIVGFSFLLASLIPKISFVFGIFGATVGQLVTFIFPCLFYILLVETRSGYPREYTDHEKDILFYFSWRKIPALLVSIVGVLFGCFSLAELIIGLYTNEL